jgi:2-C-methyl-D-erythritol 4-phosphate cytidylyltransferase/2-C-methyl-D-erythritol 2,4-cyclodiphosphate synthase
MHVTAIIAAGGRGQRFGSEQPKQLLSVGGRPILERSVTALASHPDIDALVVALPQELVDDPPPYLRDVGKPIQIVIGGDRRQDSVANAFRAVDPSSGIILIHDAARPFASADLIARTIAAAAQTGAALAAVASRDTVKRANPLSGPVKAERYVGVDDDGVEDVGVDGGGRVDDLPVGNIRTVAETLPRDTIYLAQTPQAFRREVLQRALTAGAQSGIDATDEAALVELAGLPVQLVEGDASNIKITTSEDMAMGEAIAAGQLASRTAQDAPRTDALRTSNTAAAPARTGRAGTGYDLHRLVAGRPLIIGGVTIPSEVGALGHSDADVVCHAVTDAILGAAALGDIGRHFPDSDPRWKDADSIALLRQVVALVAAQGLMVGNVDVTVVLERPKIKDYVDAMRAAVAAAMNVDVSRVSIKGKTNEGVDAIGRGEAIAAHAIALLRSAE